jgi:hypothetical protein
MRAITHVDGKAIRSSRRPRRGRWVVVEDDHGVWGGRRNRATRLRGGRRPPPVVLSRGAHARMGVPGGGGGPLGHTQDDQEPFDRGRWFAPAFARGCGRRRRARRRARVSSGAGVCSAAAETLASVIQRGAGTTGGHDCA